ncbi:MAG: HlyD family secretion protein [Rhizobiales bacterium]|nr:HlyD family secretion protein [Hyphomicrobiales bacterium]MBN9010196.1 HlyD family secretion protein [Hyphomicrobiales bacterium]
MSADGAQSSAAQQGGGKSTIVELKREADPKAAPAGAGAHAPAPAAPPSNRRRRFIIMASVPILLAIVGGYFWLTGGRYASTDNAYVSQDRVTLTADVPGRIVEVAVKTNQPVKKGDLLLRIDPAPYHIALAQADAALASARLSVDQLRATYQQALAEQAQAESDVSYNQKAFDRQQDLLKKGVASQATYDQAENALRSAQQSLTQAKEKAMSAVAGLGGDPNIETDKHPTVLAAQAKRDQAALDLANTEVHAPADGIVSQTSRLQVGAYVASAQAMPTDLLSLVKTDDTWIEANFKETDLTNMAVGQKATVSVDAYPKCTFTGEVASIGAGTGSTFSLLPAQNATGNWVKVVQRVPVRIRLDSADCAPLVMGMSASVDVDMKSGGPLAAAAATK